ncbi:hypothetical protein [Actinomadura rubrisoli]|uniref:Uncharacterized protein n=1 Tax=Actinomadura rubrisoli TaxID=2530368 RepID=A0A4R5AS29_9ACTN|nr:hypothetical protein [Actinomadura rubrisoli]TDD75075.1 hypothetical protein E1298_31955 [Actinomadura rubrisoli]
MVRRPDDAAPEPPGGRAAERLREFEAARFPEPEEPEEPEQSEEPEEEPSEGEQDDPERPPEDA